MFSPAPATLFTTSGATSMIEGAASGTANLAPTATTSLIPGTLSSRITEREPPAARTTSGITAGSRPGCSPTTAYRPGARPRISKRPFRAGCRAADGAVSRGRDRDDGAGNGRPRFVADLSGQGCRGSLRLDLVRQDEPEKKDRQEGHCYRHDEPFATRRAEVASPSG